MVENLVGVCSSDCKKAQPCTFLQRYALLDAFFLLHALPCFILHFLCFAVHAVLCALCCAVLCSAVLCCMLCCIPCCTLCMQSHFCILCHHGSRASLSCTAKSDAASHHICSICAMHDAEGAQNKGEGRKKRAGWKGVVQPFTAAGSSNAESASTHPAADRYNHPLIHLCGLAAA